MNDITETQWILTEFDDWETSDLKVDNFITVPCPECKGYTLYRDLNGNEYCSNNDCTYEGYD